MPESAFNLTALDRQLLAMTDEEFIAHDWEDLRDIIGEIPSMPPHLLISSSLLCSPRPDDSPTFIPPTHPTQQHETI